MITDWGNEKCPNCPLGYYSFLTLDGYFNIISYSWMFNENWLGDCVLISDTVEMMGKKPIFEFGKGEGYEGSECITDEYGRKSCRGGDYFKSYSGCE